MTAGAPKIQDYAVIGNGRAAALISRFGSIDWLCWPQFDSASMFAAILAPKIGGHWSIRPVADASVARRYLDDTNVLETCFETASGKIVLTDFMPVASEEEKRRVLWPENEIIRRLESQQGEAEVDIDFAPRPDYARRRFDFKDLGALGLRIDLDRHVLTLRSEAKLARNGNRASTRLKLAAGDVVSLSLSFSSEAPSVIPPLGDLVRKKLELTVNWWRSWAGQSNYRGPYQKAVNRSALLLKLLSFSPSGAIIAAPTTSLPEKIGSDRNWDYRFAWLRDAAFTVRALFGLGYEDDAEAFVNWLLHATRLTRPQLRVLYDVYGERPPDECSLDHLAGYANSAPVRLGNAASEQIQLDTYGEVVEAVAHFYQDRQIDREMQQMLRQLGQFVCKHWQEPDNGIWEYRDQPRHYTHSLLMCWVALDRLIDLHARGRMKIDLERMQTIRDEIRREIETQAWNTELEAYVQSCGGAEIDASALLLAYYGFADPRSERMQKTYVRIQQNLRPRRGLLFRDQRSVKKGEGCFAMCSFWEVDFLARSGRHEEAREVFEAALDYANDLGLFAEEIDPERGDALGNFPQAFTHLGVINAALSLADSGRIFQR